MGEAEGGEGWLQLREAEARLHGRGGEQRVRTLAEHRGVRLHVADGGVAGRVHPRLLRLKEQL